MKVLLTGSSGFIGQHCLSYLLKNGHTVVATVRSERKGKECLEGYPKFANKLSYTLVEDIAQPGAFDKAVQSSPPFDAVVHMASPFNYHATDLKKDMIDPAINGTIEVLRAVKGYAPSVRRIVITSSFAAVINFQEAVGMYTSNNWNPITMEDALSNGQMAYVGSKKFAERAAWDFVEEEKPGFTLSTINPVMVFGPVTYRLDSLDKVNTSNAVFRDIIQGKMASGIGSNSFQWVDVRDVALAHVRAMEVPEAAGKRFLATAGPYSHGMIAKIIKESFPILEDKLPEHIEPPDEPKSFLVDTTPLTEILGISYRPLKESVIDTVKSLLEVEN